MVAPLPTMERIMNRKTKAALEASIKHWEDLTNIKDIKDARIGSRECALCSLFTEQYCVGCPVRRASGEPNCHRTPYENACSEYHKNDLDKFLVEAKRELEFLISLRRFL